MISDTERTAITKLDAVQQTCTLQALSQIESRSERAIVLGKAMKLVEDALEPFKDQIMAMKGNPLGFIVDKPEDYDWAVTKRVVAEGILRGARITGNEINGISKRMYLAQAYFVRMCREWPGIVIVSERFGVPRQLNGQAVVDYKIEYTLTREADDGQSITVSDNYSREGNEAIPIRVNAGQGPDAILGKAKRKAYAGLLDQLIRRDGQDWSPGADGEAGEASDANPQNIRQVQDLSQPRINVQEWNTRIAGITNMHDAADVGRQLVNAADVRNGLWSDQDRRDFSAVFGLWLVKRLAMVTAVGELSTVQATLESINNLQRMVNIEQMQGLIASRRAQLVGGAA